MTTKKEVARLVHAIWANWMVYVLANRESEEAWERWERQAETVFEELEEHEQYSDLQIAELLMEFMGGKRWETYRRVCPFCGKEGVSVVPLDALPLRCECGAISVTTWE